MAINKLFLAGVCNTYAYSPTTGDEIFRSKTLLESSIDIKTSSTDVRAGYGNQLLYKYFHTGEMSGKLTEAQFSLNFIAANAGTVVNTGKNLWTEETVILGSGGTGSVSLTPLVQPDITGSTIYGWVTDKNGNTTKVTFTSKNFTLAGGSSGDSVTVRYYANNTAATYVQIPANIIPSAVRLVLEAQLFSGDGTASGSTLVGKAQIEIDRAQLDGTQSISLTSTGVSNTPLSYVALGNPDATGKMQYATISQILNGSNWYDNVYAICSTTDPIAISSTNSPYTLDLRAIPYSGAAFKPPYSDITFNSSAAATATVSNAGVITKVAAGTANITFTITSKNSVSGQVGVTVS